MDGEPRSVGGSRGEGWLGRRDTTARPAPTRPALYSSQSDSTRSNSRGPKVSRASGITN